MEPLKKLLEEFWVWAGICKEEYATLCDSDLEPFYYPAFDALREACKMRINTSLKPDEIDDFLTCMALDNEEEILLDWCKTIADDRFLEVLVRSGSCHLQFHARWQIAELLRCRTLPNRDAILTELAADPHEYVRKRAKNAIAYIKELI